MNWKNMIVRTDTPIRRGNLLEFCFKVVKFMVSYSWDNKFDCNGKLIGQRMHGWQDAEMLLKLLITQWAKSPRKTV